MVTNDDYWPAVTLTNSASSNAFSTSNIVFFNSNGQCEEYVPSPAPPIPVDVVAWLRERVAETCWQQ